MKQKYLLVQNLDEAKHSFHVEITRVVKGILSKTEEPVVTADVTLEPNQTDDVFTSERIQFRTCDRGVHEIKAELGNGSARTVTVKRMTDESKIASVVAEDDGTLDIFL